jgi:hypothetical protein
MIVLVCKLYIKIYKKNIKKYHSDGGANRDGPGGQ